MERVVILRPAGAGKSELARAIARRTGLPVVHLEMLFGASGGPPALRDQAVRNLSAAIAGDR